MPYNQVFSKWKAGKLHSGGPGGPVVKDQKQAIAIEMSEKKKAESGDKEYQPVAQDHPLHKLKANYRGAK